MSQASQAEKLLHAVLLSETSPYRFLLAKSPFVPCAEHEPPGLDFLFTIQAFHLGDTRSTHIARSSQLYVDVVSRFVQLTADVALFLGEQLYHRYMSNSQHFADCEHETIRAVYEKYDIPARYPLRNLIYRLYLIALTVLRNPTARIQRVKLDCLPEEMIEMIADSLSMGSILCLARANSYCRKSVARRYQRHATFVVRYEPSIADEQYWKAQRYLHVVSAAVVKARKNCTASIVRMLKDTTISRHLRYVSFKNEWESLLPSNTSILPPEPFENDEFSELYRTMIWVLSYSPIRHIRMVGLGLPRELLTHIASQPSINQLSLEAIILNKDLFPSLSSTIRLPYITALTIGFGGTERPYGFDVWTVVALCHNLQQLFVYSVDDGLMLSFPPEKVYRHIPHLHRLQKLHFQGTNYNVEPLAKWIRWAATLRAGFRIGRITHFKIQPACAVQDSALAPVLDALSEFHPHLRVLALENVIDTKLAVRRIVRSFKEIQGLSIIRLPFEGQKTVGFCQWESPAHEIAQMLSSLPKLQHFSGNFQYCRTAYGPAAFDCRVYPLSPTDTLDVEYEAQQRMMLSVRLDAESVYPSTEYAAVRRAISELESHHDNLMEALSIARVFAAYCQKLTSFAIKTEVTKFSCHVTRKPCASPVLYDIIDRDSVGSFEAWSPMRFRTWRIED